MTAFVEISHTPSGMGWNFKPVEAAAAPQELRTAKTTAKALDRKGFMSPVGAVVAIEEEQLRDLNSRAQFDSMRSQLAQTLGAIYRARLKESGVKEPKVGVTEKIVSLGVNVLFG